MFSIKIITLLTLLTCTSAYSELDSIYGNWIAVKIFGLSQNKSVKVKRCAKLKVQESSLDCPCGNYSLTVFNLKLSPGTIDKSYRAIDDVTAAFPVKSFEEAKDVGKVVLEDPECGCEISNSAIRTFNDDYFMLYLLPIKKYYPMGFLFARNLPTSADLETFSSTLIGLDNGKALCYRQ